MRIAAVEAREPLSGITLLVTEKPNEKIAQKVIESSRLKYGKKIVTKKKAKQKSSKLVEETEQTAEVTVPSGRPTPRISLVWPKLKERLLLFSMAHQLFFSEKS